jgi:hypothetical protein
MSKKSASGQVFPRGMTHKKPKWFVNNLVQIPLS